MERLGPVSMRLVAWGLGAVALAASVGPQGQDGPPSGQVKPPRAKTAKERATDEQVRSYFVICDHDGNGWISYREAKESLTIDRNLYGRFDTDRDGRMTLEEFQKGYAWIADRTQFLPRPRAARSEIVDLPRDPAQILTAYDADDDGGLDEGEIGILLYDYGRNEIPAQLALERLDENADGVLRAGELELLARLIATLHVAGPDAGPRAKPPASVSELFGKPIQRPGLQDRSPQPPLIVGPVPIFRRLDLDDDGGIEVEDLRGLLSPLQIGVSLSAIHATIDTDEDGRIDTDELDRALGARR